MDALRKQLDVLMGANRNGDVQEVARKYYDRDVCRLFLAGVCPHELFQLTKIDMGPCPKVHSLQLRKEYEEAKAKGVDNYDRDLEDTIDRLIVECDRKISRALKRLDEEDAKAAIAISVSEVTQTPETIELSKQIKEKLKEVDRLDFEGNTDMKIRAVEELEELRVKRADMQANLLLDAFNKDRASLPQPLTNASQVTPMPAAVPDPRIQEMINEKLKKAEELGEQGMVDEAQKALEEAEALKKLPAAPQEPVLDSSKYTAADVRITDQKLRVCDICGAFLSVYDSDRRLADHFGGKLHLGYMQIREKLADLQARCKIAALKKQKKPNVKPLKKREDREMRSVRENIARSVAMVITTISGGIMIEGAGTVTGIMTEANVMTVSAKEGETAPALVGLTRGVAIGPVPIPENGREIMTATGVDTSWASSLQGGRSALCVSILPVLFRFCDEATSALDSTTEAEILNALKSLANNRTAIFIAHRLTTAMQCDDVCRVCGYISSVIIALQVALFYYFSTLSALRGSTSRSDSSLALTLEAQTIYSWGLDLDVGSRRTALEFLLSRIRVSMASSSVTPVAPCGGRREAVIVRTPVFRTIFLGRGVGTSRYMDIQLKCSRRSRSNCHGGAFGVRMSLFDRFARVVKSYANALISTFEDPEKILDQAVLEMNEDLIKLRQATARVLASQKQLENRYKAAQQASEDWYRRAQLALGKGDEDLAREALTRRKSYSDNANAMKTQIDQQKAVVDNLVNNTRLLESKIQEAKSKKDTLKARAQSAKTATKVNEMLGNVNTSSSLSAFEKMEEKVMAMESEAEALNQLTSDDLEGKVPFCFKYIGDILEFALLETSSVDDDLANLKKELSGSTKKGDLPAGRTPVSSLKFQDPDVEKELNELRQKAQEY
ncbi:ATP binding protein [Striga asiatica]|uniref:ATP binding protein n=2 Tax=Magnoliopsida TaxID=3398 RepID=A0A5A7R1U4_STRAF|nr:ATP binding protein [Striga asiatica]